MAAAFKLTFKCGFFKTRQSLTVYHQMVCFSRKSAPGLTGDLDFLTSKCNQSNLSPTAPKLQIWWNSHKQFMIYCANKLRHTRTPSLAHRQRENRIHEKTATKLGKLW